MADYVWTKSTHTLRVDNGSIPTANEKVKLYFNAKFPFLITADSAVSPTIDYCTTAPGAMTIGEGQAIADTLLAAMYQRLITVTWTQRTAGWGWLPGQQREVLSTIQGLGLTVLVTSLDAFLHTDSYWVYRITGTGLSGALPAYQGSSLDYFRRLGGGGSTSMVRGSGAGPTLSLDVPTEPDKIANDWAIQGTLTTEGDAGIGGAPSYPLDVYGIIQTRGDTSVGGLVNFGNLDNTGFSSIQNTAATGGNELSLMTGGVVTLKIAQDGVITATGFGLHTFTSGGTGANTLRVLNTTSGAGNYADVQATAGTTTGTLRALSQAFTTSNYNVQSGVALTNGAAGGISIAADNAAGTVRFHTAGATQVAQFDLTSSLQIGGTAARGTTTSTKRIDIFNGTAPAGTLTNGVSLYSASGELTVMDSSGNATPLSPHDDDNKWVFRSKNTVTGECLHIDMEDLVDALEQVTGRKFSKRWTEPVEK